MCFFGRKSAKRHSCSLFYFFFFWFFFRVTFLVKLIETFSTSTKKKILHFFSEFLRRHLARPFVYIG